MSSRTENPHVTFCLRNKILVYPVLFDTKKKTYKIEANVAGKKKTFDKIIHSNEIDSAMNKTYKFYYDKFKNT